MTKTKYQLATSPSTIDIRDYPFIPKILPADFAEELDLLPEVEEVEDQLHVGSCVANGVLSACESIGKRNGQSLDLSRMALYTMAKSYEGRLDKDGLSPRSAFVVARHYGIVGENGADGYPYDTAKQYQAPPESVYQQAVETRIQRYEAVIAPGQSFGLETEDKINRIKSALNEGHQVGIAFAVTDSIYAMTGPWRDQKYKPVSFINQPIGSHYMVIIGYNKDRWLVQNSWGPNWGDGGFGGFPLSIVDEPFLEAWIVRKFDDMGIPESSGAKMEFMNAFQITARVVPEPELVGEQIKIWIGAVLRDGTWYLKTDSSDHNWIVVAPGSDLQPTFTITAQEYNPITIVNWRYLGDFKGADFYVGYGKNLETAKISQICTVPDYV